MDKYDEAIKVNDEAILFDSRDQSPSPQLWNGKGVALYKQRKYNKAAECFDMAIRLWSKYTGAWNNKSKALRLLGKSVEAEAAFAKARELEWDGQDNTSDLEY